MDDVEPLNSANCKKFSDFSLCVGSSHPFYFMELLKQFYNFDSLQNGTIIGHCQLCGSVYNDKIGSTGNFHKHLKRKHKKEYYELKKQGDDISSLDLDGETDQTNGSADDRINQSIVLHLIIKCNLPPSIVDRPDFRSFLKCLAPKWKSISSRHVKEKMIPTLVSLVRDKIDTMLKNVEHLSITCDIWTDRRGKSFIGLTGHFLDVDFKLQAVLLDFIRLKGRHTGEHIRSITEEILERLNISEKVYRIITDNASNMVKAYRFGLTVLSDGKSNQSLHVDDEECLSDNENVHDDDLYTQNHLVLTDPIDENGNNSSQIQNTRFRLSCFAHSLQLAIRDGLTDIPILSKTLLKCNKISNKSHKSTKIADLLDDVDKKLKRSNVTRWNSEYLMIKSVLHLGKETIEEITKTIDDDDLVFTNNDFSVLRELIDILEPFADITISCQSEIATTVSMVVPSIVHIIHHLAQMKMNVLLLDKLLSQLKQSINLRFSGIVKRLSMKPVTNSDPFGDPIYFIATILDPKFRFRWLGLLKLPQSSESKVKQSLLDLILDECELNDNTEDDRSSSMASIPSQQSITTSESSTIKKRKLFEYDDDDLCSNNSELSPSDELAEYIDEPNRLNSFDNWKFSPLSSLKCVVQRVFSIQASSAPIERAFSQSGLIMSPRRTSMRDELFQSLVFLRVNKHLL